MEINGKTKKWLVLGLCFYCGSLWGEMSQTHDELLVVPAVQAPDEEILTKYSDAPTVQKFEEKPQVQTPQNKSKVKRWFANAWKKVKEFLAPIAKELQDELSKQANELAKQAGEAAREAAKQAIQQLRQKIQEAPQRAAAAAIALYDKFHTLHPDALKMLVTAADTETKERQKILRQYVQDYGKEDRTQYRKDAHLENLTDAKLAQHLRTHFIEFKETKAKEEFLKQLPLTILSDLWDSLLPQEISTYFPRLPLYFRSMVYGCLLFQNSTADIAYPLFTHISDEDRILYAPVLLKRAASRAWLQRNIHLIPATIRAQFEAILNPQFTPEQPMKHNRFTETSSSREDTQVQR